MDQAMWQVAPTSGEASPLPLQAAGSDKGLLLYHRYPHPSVPHTASGLGTLRVLLNQRLRPEIPTVGHANNTRVIMIRNISKGEPSRKYALMESDSQCAYIYDFWVSHRRCFLLLSTANNMIIASINKLHNYQASSK